MKKETKKELVDNKTNIKKLTAKKKEVDVKKTTTKEKKDNVFKKIGKYFKGVGKEFQRIRWTDGRDLVKYSVATLLFVIFFGVYFYGIDWIALLVRSLAK